MNQFEVLAGEEPASKESEVFRFQSLVPDAKIALQEKVNNEYPRFDTAQYPASVSLLACSSAFGYYVAATLEGFVFGSTETLRSTTKSLEKGGVGVLDGKIVIKVQGAVQHLRLTAEQARIVVTVTNGEVLVYNAKDIVQKRENAAPVQTFKLNDDIIDIRPNPDALPNLAAVLLKSNQCKFVDLCTGEVVATIAGNDITSLCWSPKGKQVVCGRKDGKLETFDTSGQSKASVDAPPEMKEAGSRYVLGVLWIETHVFLAVYAQRREGGSDEHIHDAFIVNRKSEKAGGGLHYTHLDEVTPVFSMDDRGANLHMEIIRNFSEEMKTAVIIAHSAATDISVVGQDEHGDWATWMLPENGLASLPLSEETNMDTFAIGLAVDFSTSEPLPPYDPATSSESVKPMPTLYFLNDEDQICAYHCYNSGLAERGQKYPGMVDAKDVLEAPGEFAATPAPAAAPAAEPEQPQQPQQQPFATGAFGAALQQQQRSDDGFAALLSGKATESPAPVTGFGFGSGGNAGSGGGFSSFRNLTVSSNAKNPSSGGMFGSGGFGAPAGFGGAAAKATGAPPTFGSTSFGTTPATAQPAQSLASLGGKLAEQPQQRPAFGQTTSFGATASSTSATGPAFGSTSFGTQPSAPQQAQSFASLATKQATSTPAFGSTGFGSTPAFGSTSFGSAPAFSTKPSAPATSEEKPAKPEPTFGFGTAFTSALSKTDAVKNEEELAVKAEESEAEEEKEPKPEQEPEESQPEREEPKPEPQVQVKPEPVDEEPADKLKEPLAEPETSAPQVAELPEAPEVVTPPTTEKEPSTEAAAAKKTTSFSFGTEQKKDTDSLFKTPTSGSNLFGSSESKPVFGSASGFGAAQTPGFASLTKTDEAATKSLKEPQPFGVSTPTPAADSTEQKQSFASMDKTQPLSGFKAAPSATEGFRMPETKMAPPPVSEAPISAPAKAALATPKPKPTAEEGMASEFEQLYLAMNDALKKLEAKQAELKQAVDSQRRQSAASKTYADLRNAPECWTVADARDLNTVADDVAAKAQVQRPKIIQIKQSLGYFEEDAIKLQAKRSTIEQLMETKPDPKLKKDLKDRELDKQTLAKWEQLKARCKTYGEQLDGLENKIHNEKMKMRSPVRAQETKLPSLYALYLQLREIDKELKSKEQQTKDLEEQMAYIRFKQVHQNAHYSPSRISLDDDDEDEDEEQKDAAQSTERKDTEGPWRAALLESTSRYLRRERFLDRIHEFKNQKCM